MHAYHIAAPTTNKLYTNPKETAFERTLLFQCSPKLPQSLIWLVICKIIITYDGEIFYAFYKSSGRDFSLSPFHSYFINYLRSYNLRHTITNVIHLLNPHIWSVDLSCSVTFSFSANSFTNRKNIFSACPSISAR